MISPVRFSDWAAPIVPVVKNDGTICICGDYKVTANLVAKQDYYPLPHVEDLFAKVSGGRFLRHAYLQIELDEESKNFTTINTHKGLFQYHLVLHQLHQFSNKLWIALYKDCHVYQLI